MAKQPRAKLGKKSAETIERERQVVSLRTHGYTYQQISDELGLAGAGSAYGVYKRVMQRVIAETQEEAEEMRRAMVERMDNAMVAIYERVKEGDLDAIATMLRLDAQRSKLYGLDAPSKVEANVNNWLALVQAAKEGQGDG